MAATGSWRVILVITAHTCFACISASNEQQITNSTVVTSGYELHAALTSPQITRIYVSNNVSTYGFGERRVLERTMQLGFPSDETMLETFKSWSPFQSLFR